MYLKSLNLKGFKSFADKTHMVFDPGLTVVVGPNGSGKSNISDAILWVLGEQSAKHLRGSAMQDVVFAGSAARKSVSVAEVDLVLDNSDHVLPVDFSEVAITRRMYRSGESEYLVNGAPARLLDVQDILHDSGLGKDTHSIISQGKLDEVLSSRPEERRALIEEAAGISKHKRRRERALRRLASMDEHLKRGLALQREVARQIKPLERQVERAREYNELTARATDLAVSLAVDDLRRLRAQWDEASHSEREASAQMEASEYLLGERKRELERLQVLLEEKGLYVGDLSEQRSRCQTLCERISAQRGVLAEKARALEARLSQARQTLARDAERGEERAAEIEQVARDLVEGRGELGELRRRSEQAKQAGQQVRAQRREAEDGLAQLNAQARSLTRERDASQNAYARAKDALDGAHLQDQLLADRLAQLDDVQDQAAARLEQAQALLSDVEAALAGARQRSADLDQTRDAARRALEQAQGRSVDAAAKASACRAEALGLRRVAEAEEGRAPLAARLAKDAAASAYISGHISELLEVPQELASLVESLLGERLRGFVVNGRPESLVQASLRAAALSGVAGQVSLVAPAPETDAFITDGDAVPVCDLIGAHGEAGGVARALLGDFILASSIEDAIRLSELDGAHVYVTRDGARARGGREVLVGHPDDCASGLLEHRRRLRLLAEQQAAHDAEEQQARTVLAQARDTLAQAESESAAAASEVARVAGERASAQAEVARAQRALDDARKERDGVMARRQAQARGFEQAADEMARHEAELASLNERMVGLDEKIARAEEALEGIRRSDRANRDEANDCSVRLARVQERVKYLDSRYNQLSREAREAQSSVAAAREEAMRLKAMSGRFAPLDERLASLEECAKARNDRLREHASVAQADSAALRQTIDGARRAVDEAQATYQRALESMSEAKVLKGRLDVEVGNAVGAITSHPGVVLEEALSLPEPQDRAGDERELARLRDKIAALGPVNQVAFQEYAALKERADYMAAQVADLQHARADLNKILGIIDAKMRRGFIDTFEVVDRNFQEIFAMLFPGGSGHLEMTDPDDPAQTGIEVVAQPQGKRVTKMSLLSGGERSLTALGLLFAVYRTRTVPFYVLDEVEAALDDTNLDRLLAAIDALREKTQLIVISHQRRTMERADVLYGVSMQADGVSHVVSQRLDPAMR